MKPGWYQLPTDSTKLVYWDGSQWVGEPIPNPAFVSHPDSADGSVPAFTPTNSKVASNYENSKLTAKSHSKISDVIGGILLLVMSIIFITVSVTSLGLSDTLTAGDKGTRVVGTATVVGMEYTSEGYCIPQLQKDSDSPIVSADMTVHVSPCPVTVGEVVDVSYLESDPDELKIETNSVDVSSVFTLLPVVFGLVGVVLGISGITSIVKTLRKNRQTT